MRVFLILVLTFVTLSAIGSAWYRSRLSQDQHVSRLIDLARATEHAEHPNWTKVLVVYDRDLEWWEDEGRYVLDLQFQERTGVNAWLAGNDLLFLFESPTLILIICNDYGESGLAGEIVDEIKQLNSIKQIWVDDRAHDYDSPAHRDIKRLFPDLITESPHLYTY